MIFPRLASSVRVASIWALVCGASLLVFIIATIMLVQGHGYAPGVTHGSMGVIAFTSGLFGVKPSIGVTVAFWSCVVFLVVFFCAFVLHRGLDGSDETERRRSDTSAVVLFLAFGLFVGFNATRKVTTHASKLEEAREMKLAIEFVRSDPELLALAGDQRQLLRAGIPLGVTVHQRLRNRQGYDIEIVGLNRVYAIVEVSRDTTPPTFKLLCTTPLAPGHRDTSSDDPCEQ